MSFLKLVTMILKWECIVVMIGCIVAVIAAVEILRVAHGSLFLFPMPWEDPPQLAEIIDAKTTARVYLLPGLLFLISVAFIVALHGRHVIMHPNQLVKQPLIILVPFLFSASADLLSSLWCFHMVGIDSELHPGIRLFAYAYGRTIGAVAGKSVQVIGILGLAAMVKRIARPTIVIATVLYAGAAIYNCAFALWT